MKAQLNRSGQAFLVAMAFGVVAGVGVKPVSAGPVLSLVPNPGGPYFGGEHVTIDVWLHNDRAVRDFVRFVQLDFSETDPAIDLDPTFTFDYSSVPFQEGNVFIESPTLPVPSNFMPFLCTCPSFLLQLPGSGQLHLGSVGAQLPFDPGTYVMDILNADEPDPLLGAGITLDNRAPSPLRAYGGQLGGEAYVFTVVPEPVTALLLLAGALFVAGRRREKTDRAISRSVTRPVPGR